MAAMKDANPRSRHPLHRFCPQQYPAVIDADFLSLYTRQPRARPPVEKLQQETFDSAFSKLHYRAPSAPASWGDGACIGIKDVVSLPWRPVPRAVSPDNLSLLDDVRCVLLQLFFNGSLFWVPVLLIWVWRRHCKTRRRKVMFALVVLSLVFFPIRPRPAIRKWRGWHKFHRYHRTSVIVEQAHQFPPKEPTIYAVFPHGIVPAAPVSDCRSNLEVGFPLQIYQGQMGLYIFPQWPLSALPSRSNPSRLPLKSLYCDVRSGCYGDRRFRQLIGTLSANGGFHCASVFDLRADSVPHGRNSCRQVRVGVGR